MLGSRPVGHVFGQDRADERALSVTRPMAALRAYVLIAPASGLCWFRSLNRGCYCTSWLLRDEGLVFTSPNGVPNVGPRGPEVLYRCDASSDYLIARRDAERRRSRDRHRSYTIASCQRRMKSDSWSSCRSEASFDLPSTRPAPTASASCGLTFSSRRAARARRHSHVGIMLVSPPITSGDLLMDIAARFDIRTAENG